MEELLPMKFSKKQRAWRKVWAGQGFPSAQIIVAISIPRLRQPLAAQHCLSPVVFDRLWQSPIHLLLPKLLLGALIISCLPFCLCADTAFLCCAVLADVRFIKEDINLQQVSPEVISGSFPSAACSTWTSLPAAALEPTNPSCGSPGIRLRGKGHAGAE